MTPEQQNTIGLLIRNTGDVDLYQAFVKTCERARNVGALDAWAQTDAGCHWGVYDNGRNVMVCYLEFANGQRREFDSLLVGVASGSADAARAAAAKAIEAGEV